MLAIDNNFDMYQFTELNWKNTPLNITRGSNNSKLQDLLYDTDGKMYGLVFNPNSFMVQLMKQTSVFYLAEFVELNNLLESDNSLDKQSDFVISNQDIIKCKIGSLYDYLAISNANDVNDDDPNFAYQRQVIENKAKLLNFCANRNIVSGDNYDNYDLLASVDKNNDKISKLKNIINSLLVYEPDNMIIKQNNPIIS